MAAAWDACWHGVTGTHVNRAAQHIQKPEHGTGAGGRRAMSGYLGKYMGKGLEILDHDVVLVAELARVVWGRRLVATFGTCHGLKPVSEDEAAGPRCPRCGGRMDCSAVLEQGTGRLVRNRDWSGADP